MWGQIIPVPFNCSLFQSTDQFISQSCTIFFMAMCYQCCICCCFFTSQNDETVQSSNVMTHCIEHMSINVKNLWLCTTTESIVLATTVYVWVLATSGTLLIWSLNTLLEIRVNAEWFKKHNHQIKYETILLLQGKIWCTDNKWLWNLFPLWERNSII